MAARARRLADRVAASRHSQVHRSSYALILTTVTNAALGLLFWVAAARLYPTEVVGLGAGGISALQLAATIGWVGLIFTLMRYVPIAGTGRRRLIASVYLIGGGAAVAVAVAFTVALASRLNVPYLSESVASGVAFCACVAVWAIFTLQDSALISLRRAGVVAGENVLYGALKLVLLIALSAFAHPWTLLGVWAGAALVFVVAVSGFLLFRDPRVRAPAEPAEPTSRRAIARFSSGHTAAALMAIVPDYLVPLLVLHYLDPAANAYYYSAWSVSLSARALSVNVTDALMVEAAYGQETFAALLGKVGRLFAVVLIPTVLVVVAAAEPVLRIFGSAYAGEGAAALRYFGLSLVPFTVVTLALALDRIRQRFANALLITSTGTLATIALDVLLIPRHGIAGAGLGWLAGQALAALIAAHSLWRELGARTPGAGHVVR
ncbi:MAG TPA: polysaccharide biosynthesis C-terminal domain-containing protein [Solirubrobacteraceae bacterium]|nr:polysaccharide biosynthesis C-terminal domain-containing protein [Solirubrobacteraceae bacterium]